MVVQNYTNDKFSNIPTIELDTNNIQNTHDVLSQELSKAILKNIDSETFLESIVIIIQIFL
jgi:hypothetical protein